MRIDVEDAILVLIKKGHITEELLDTMLINGAITQKAHDYYVACVTEEEDNQ